MGPRAFLCLAVLGVLASSAFAGEDNSSFCSMELRASAGDSSSRTLWSQTFPDVRSGTRPINSSTECA